MFPLAHHVYFIVQNKCLGILPIFIYQAPVFFCVCMCVVFEFKHFKNAILFSGH